VREATRGSLSWVCLLLAALLPVLSCSAVDDVTGPGGSASGPGGSGSGGQQPPATTGSLTLGWDAPSANEDGSPLTDLAGYNVYYSRTTPVTVTNSTVVQLATVTTATLSDLMPGTYFVAVAARDVNGNISGLSASVRAEVSP